MHLNQQEVETKRLAALNRYSILDTPAEESFDCITRIAKIALDVSIALIVLVDRDRQWFKSKQGVQAIETTRDVSFCARTIEGDRPLMVPNLKKDSFFKDNPLVDGFPFLRSYCGTPLRTQDGYNIGSLCVMGHRPRKYADSEIAILVELSRLVMDQVELRHLADVDYLTGLATRRFFLNTGKKEAERTRADNVPLSMVMFEITEFNDISRRYGHNIGDTLVRAIADGCRSVVKDGMIFARVNEGRFAILMPATHQALAAETEKKILSVIDKVKIPDIAITGRLDCQSTSVAFGPEDKDFMAFYNRAEIILQKAKSVGQHFVNIGQFFASDVATYSYGKV
jgi:diguanylate cyclase (GGDEF)-like protein